MILRQPFFKAFFFHILDKYNSPHLLLGGDFNLVAHSALDRSRAGSATNAFPETLKTLLHSHNLVDSLRAHNVGAREYTFYSHPHDSYSRLDYLFCTPILLANSTTAAIHSCPWSDHQVVSLNISHIGLSLPLQAGR